MKKNNYKKKLNLKDDLVFQKIFGSPENSEITSHFLSLILKRDINNINLDANKNLLGEYIDDKNSALDVRAIINDGEDLDLEMQARKFGAMTNRMAFYASKMLTHETKIGSDYEEMQPCFVILIANYRLDETKGSAKYHAKAFVRIDDLPNKLLTNVFEFHILELPKLRNADIKKDELALWLKFIANPNNEEVNAEMVKEENKYLRELKEKLERLNSDPEFDIVLEAREMFLRDQIQIQSDNVKRGKIEGMAEGRREGKEEGKAEGRQEKAIEIAKKMLEMDLPIEQIIQLTGLTKKDIDSLKVLK